MKLAICDDEQIFIDQFTSLVYKKYARLDVVINTYTSGLDLLDSIKNGAVYDALFLDIEMDEIDGMSLAREIRKLAPEIPLSFLTSHIEMAIDGYEVAAFRFLKKPVDEAKLYQTIEDLKQYERGRRGIIIKENGEEIVIVPSSVLFIESDNNDIRIITGDKTYICRMKIGDIIDQLNEVSDTFRRVHRSTAINMAHISRISDKDAVLDNGGKVAISRSMYKTFKEEFYSYVKRSAR